jgi:two-component system OmpR family response regulator
MPRANDRNGLAGLRVLLVEDADDIRDLLALLLRSEGAEVCAVGTARAAMAAAATWTFDILLTDLGLPDLAGEHLIRELRATMPRRVRVVVVTGFGEPHVAQARQAGADAVFIKPLEWPVLRDQLVPRDERLAA